MFKSRSYRKLLKNLSDKLCQDELNILKFLCVDVIHLSALERLNNGLLLWKELERTGLLGPSNCSFLAEILTLAGRVDLAKELSCDEESSHVAPFRRLLCELGKQIPQNQLESVKFLFADEVSAAASEMARNIWEFFLLLEKKGLLSPTNIENLHEIVHIIQHESLYSLITEYESKNSTLKQKPLADEFNRCQISASEVSFTEKCISKVPPSGYTSPVTSAVSQATNKINNSSTAFDQTERYTIESSPKGFCILVNNQRFQQNLHDRKSKQLKDRPGSEVDEDELIKVFEFLDFEVFSYKDQTAKEMKQLFKDYARKQEMNKADVLVVIILSHGSENVVYGADGCALEIKELLNSFNAQACPALINKPKLFFIQACQGNQAQEACAKIYTDAVEEETDGFTPKDADFFLGIATVEGCRSFRHVEKGTWFIRCLTDVLRERAYKDDLESIMTEVRAEVSKFSYVDGTSRKKQMPYTYSTLRKKVFLIPIQKKKRKLNNI